MKKDGEKVRRVFCHTSSPVRLSKRGGCRKRRGTCGLDWPECGAGAGKRSLAKFPRQNIFAFILLLAQSYGVLLLFFLNCIAQTVFDADSIPGPSHPQPPSSTLRPSTKPPSQPVAAPRSSFVATMTRGNQREKAREKNLKDAKGQGKKNTQSGTAFQRTKEDQAAIMREKQAKAEAARQAGAAGPAETKKK